MSNAVFPVLPGLAWDILLSPLFNTKVHRSVSGYEVRAAFMVYPLWKFALKYEVLRDNASFNELRTLVGFYNARQGQFDSFLYSNPSDSSVTAQQFGVGTGSQFTFQLTRSFGGYVEPVHNLNGNPSIYVNGVLKTLTTDYTISATGLVTFLASPPNGASITWTGSFYYRCRFLSDTNDFNQFMKNLYNLSKLEFIGSPMNKV
ncbi:MAG TPA: DUF2460 domain-containing protein [Gallionella sp.]|nr:DUF2460 domain-containing protein [Gallionella sp.]